MDLPVTTPRDLEVNHSAIGALRRLWLVGLTVSASAGFAFYENCFVLHSVSEHHAGSGQS